MTFDARASETILFSGNDLPPDNATWILGTPPAVAGSPWNLVGLSMAVGGVAAVALVAISLWRWIGRRRTVKPPPKAKAPPV